MHNLMAQLTEPHTCLPLGHRDGQQLDKLLRRTLFKLPPQLALPQHCPMCDVGPRSPSEAATTRSHLITKKPCQRMPPVPPTGQCPPMHPDSHLNCSAPTGSLRLLVTHVSIAQCAMPSCPAQQQGQRDHTEIVLPSRTQPILQLRPSRLQVPTPTLPKQFQEPAVSTEC